MRFPVFFFIALFLWAGTISIRYGDTTPKPEPAQAQTCQGKTERHMILDLLQKGRIIALHDDGQKYTFSLPSNWTQLPPAIQRNTYEVLSCYAQAQDRTFKILLVQR